MKRMLAAAALMLWGCSTALAFEQNVQAIVDGYKAQKPVTGADVGELMRQSERWCYAQENGQCAWSDIYLDVTAEDARFEISNAWSEDVDISFVDRGLFNGNQICETGADWTETVHARNRADGTAIGGRDLEAIKDELANRGEAVIDCFDYLYVLADEAAQTVTLQQRQYTDGAYQGDADVAVTLHFDPASASALQLRW